MLGDGADAQYGSDAIAGVIKFRLKDNRDGLTVSARYRQYYERDGQDLTLQADAGLPLTADGFFNISAECVRAKPTSHGAQRPDAQALINAGTRTLQCRGNVHTGSARLFVNSEVQAFDSATAYLFDNYSWSTGDTELFYRNAVTRTDIFRSLLPRTSEGSRPAVSGSARSQPARKSGAQPLQTCPQH